MKKRKALLFDFDGVLADTFEFCYQINLGLMPELTRDEYRARFNGNIFSVMAKMKEKPKYDKFDFFAAFTPKLLATPMNEKIRTLVEKFSRSHSLFIISSTTSDPIKQFLAQNNILYCFQGILGKDHGKSKVEKINGLLKAYGLKTHDCLFITDTLGDIEEARACGINSIAVTWGYHPKKTLFQGKPFALAETLEELETLIEE